MTRSVMCAVGLLIACCAGNEPGERVERVPSADVSGRVMAIAEEALAFCPGADDTDASAAIAAAQRGGWARFVDQETLPERQGQLSRRMQPSDFDRISVRKVEASDRSNVWGQVRMVIGQRGESPGPDGSITRESIGCSLHIVPRNSGVAKGMVTDAEAEAGLRVMTRLAGAPPSISYVNQAADPPGSESVNGWTFRLTGHGMELTDPDQPYPSGERRRDFRVDRRSTGLFYFIGNSRRWVRREPGKEGSSISGDG